MIREAAGAVVAKAGVKLETVVFSGLAVEAAKAAGANLIVRGPARRRPISTMKCRWRA